MSDPANQRWMCTSCGLIYDPGAKQYSYVWKTSTSWANSCRVLHVMLKDGTDHLAYVHFTK